MAGTTGAPAAGGDAGTTGEAGARGGAGAATSGALARAGSERLGFRLPFMGGDGQLDVLKRWSHWPDDVLAILRPIVLQETERAFW